MEIKRYYTKKEIIENGDLKEILLNLNLGIDFEVEKIDVSIAKMVGNSERKINLFDMGKGSHAFLSLIIASHNSSSKLKLIPEEPETHLHPMWQSKLAEVFLTSDKKLLIETHSEYMIRKAQVMVAKGQVKPEEVGIIYLGADPSAPDYVRHIDILPNGRLSQDFGPGFFDESTKLLVELMQYGGLN